MTRIADPKIADRCPAAVNRVPGVRGMRACRPGTRGREPLRLALAAAAVLTLCGCRPAFTGEPASDARTAGQPAAPVVAAVAAEPLADGAATDVAFWSGAGNADDLRAVVAAGEGGLQVYTVAGRHVGGLDEPQADLVEVLPSFNGGSALIIAYDPVDSVLRPFTLEDPAGRLSPVEADPIRIEDELVGLCSYRSALSKSWFLYGVTDEGLVLQWELHRDDGGRLAGRLLRTIPTGKGSGYCVVDPAEGVLYLSDEELGVWRLGAEPESDTTRSVLDLAEPWGRLGDEIKGIGLYRIDSGRGYLLLADVGAALVHVYALPAGDYRGAVTVDGLSEPEGLAATHLGGGFVAIADEDEADGATRIRLIGWAEMAEALALARASGPIGERPAIPVVTPTLETDVVESYGDAADDPAIWVHPDDPTLSLVLGTQKQMGLHVYDLDGRTLQTLPDGRLNNVDVRDGFPLGGEAVSLAVASNRTFDSLSFYRVDAAQRRLVNVSDGIVPAGMADPYGLCLYRSRSSGSTYAFVNDSGTGRVVQFRLFESAPGRVSAQPVREFEMGSQSEGCVADDETGVLYIAEEDFGVYRYPAEPDAGNARKLLDSVEGGRLAADVEGVALWGKPDGTGYLVVSSQGTDNFVVYRREDGNEYVGTFHIVADPERGIDGVAETDGLDVTSAPLGPAYPQGLLVAQDGRNIAPAQRQNFKFVSWADIARELALE